MSKHPCYITAQRAGGHLRIALQTQHKRSASGDIPRASLACECPDMYSMQDSMRSAGALLLLLCAQQLPALTMAQRTLLGSAATTASTATTAASVDPITIGVASLAVGVSNAATGISNIIKGDAEKRERFARELSASLHRQFPRYRVMVVSVPWEISGTGIVRQRAELKYWSGATQGYDVLFIPVNTRATFIRKGDGGWINWAWAGPNWRRSGNQGRVVDFY